MLDLLQFEYPTQEEVQEFLDLLEVHRGEWKVQLAGYVWSMGTLWEYEYRWIFRKLNGMDPITKERLLPLEILNAAIVEIQRLSDGIVFSFRYETNKTKLRHLLLSMSPMIVDQLYKAYQIGESHYKEEFQKKHKDDIERITKGFFVEFGGSSGS